MSIAETAELAVNLRLGTTGSFAGATSQLHGVEQAAAGAQTRGVGVLHRGFGAATTAAGKFGGALGHAKSQLGGLITGPLGLAGLGVGLFSVGGALEQGIEKATEMGKAASRLAKITGLNVETTSALSAAMEHFGIGVDKQLRSVGFLEKNVGLLASRKNGIADFEKTFSFALTDTNGKLKDANALILASADYFNNKSIPATTKAAALAKLYGRSWQDLIPFLSAGRKGIADAEEEAKKFGLTLTKDNIGQLAKLREATRSWQTALGGLEVQIGLLVVGPLTDLAKFGTTFLAENKDKITGFFKNLIHGAQDFAAFLTGTVIPTVTGLGSAAASAWGAIPPGLRDLLVKGFVANKVVKFAFGVDIAGGIGDVITRSLGTIIGKNIVQPVFVTNQLPGGGLPGAALKGEGLLASVGLTVPVLGGLLLGVAAAAGLGILLDNAINAKGGMGPALKPLEGTGVGLGTAPIIYDPSIPAGQRRVFGGKGGGYIVVGTGVSADRNSETGGIRPDLSFDTRSEGAGIRNAPRDLSFDTRSEAAGIRGAGMGAIVRAIDALHMSFNTDLAALIHATKANDISKAARKVAAEITKGVGNVDTTKGVLGELQRKLAGALRTHDPKLASELRAAIAKVERRLPGREFAAKEFAATAGILKDGKITASESGKLKSIMQALKDRGLPHAAAEIQKKIDAAKKAQTAAANKTTEAIKDKDLSVAVSVPVTVNAEMSLRNFSRVTIRGTKFGKYANEAG